MKNILNRIVQRMSYARMVSVLSQMDDKQLHDIGVERSQILDVARKIAYQ
jgi:uncharacterized protein YjiS (DUF1127 family)